MKEMTSPEYEESAEVRLSRLLKERGVEDPETKNLLDAWIQAEEDRVEKENTSLATIELNIKRGRLYFNAGYVDEAYESFEAARLQAWNENEEELYGKIMAEMDSLGI